MRPKYEEIRRMIMLALGNWTDFLNTLNSILYSKSYLHNEDFFAEIHKESGYSDEVKEALLLISFYWNRQSENVLALGAIGLRLSKPHTRFQMTLLSQHPDHEECARLVTGATQGIDKIEIPIYFVGHGSIILDAIDIDLEDESQTQNQDMVLKYNKEMLQQLCIPDPYIRAGIELQLLLRGFTL
jgi:hypothetical protein